MSTYKTVRITKGILFITLHIKTDWSQVIVCARGNPLNLLPLTEGVTVQLPINYISTHWTVRKQAREQYVREQDGKCCHCGESLKGKPSKEVQEAYINLMLFPAQMFKHPIHLHHCHKTQMTIGAVHARCNAWLWQYKGE